MRDNEQLEKFIQIHGIQFLSNLVIYESEEWSHHIISNICKNQNPQIDRIRCRLSSSLTEVAHF